MKKLFLSLSMALAVLSASAQNVLTRDQILAMTVEQLSELPLEDLMAAVETLGVTSVDELFNLIMNKNVSSASKAEEDSFTSPLSTTVITKDEMRTYGILTIEEAFRLIPGMIVSEKTPGNFDIHMRGLNSIPDNSSIMYTENANTLLMIDGRPMHNYGIAAITMDLMPISIEDVERIEVVRGACGALYGANAVNGVINIITEKPSLSSKKIAGSIQVGNNNNAIADLALRHSGHDGKVALGLSVNAQKRGRSSEMLPSAPAAKNRYYVEDDALLAATRNMPVSQELLDEWVANGQIRYAIDEEVMTAADLDRYRTFVANTLTNSIEPAADPNAMFENPRLARSNYGLNGYFSLVPADNVRFDLTGGYHQSLALVSTAVDFVAPLSYREAKKGYVNLNAKIKDFSVNIGYNAGCQDYVKRLPGFKLWEQSFNANAEYSINLGDLAIKPGFFYEWIKFEDYLPVYNTETSKAREELVQNGVSHSEAYDWHLEKPGTEPAKTNDRLFGFFNKETHLYSVAPSLRLDYKVGDLRLIGAFRSDKTRIPDKWNHSWQLAANYNINSRNFIRFVYGRANRSCCLINTSADYRWDRTYMMPSKIFMVGNPEADIVHIDNVELGYRWRPTDKILLDAEVFFSHSEDFGFLKSEKSMFALSAEDLSRDMMACATVLRPNGFDYATMGGYTYQNGMETRAYLKYVNVPFEVNQFGLSLNLDYIISSKLIAKLNLNVQRTIINNYYEYNKNVAIEQQLGAATQQLYANLLSGKCVKEFFECVDAIKEASGVSDAEAVSAFFSDSKYSNDLKAFGEANSIAREGSDFSFGATTPLPLETEDGVKHKATPSIYGMAGLIYKPVNELTVSAFANVMGKRTYKTGYGVRELDNRCTVNLKVGYRPMPKFEVFANAHNLFNSEAQEFIYSDKIGGTYTVGVNFGF